MPKTAGTSIERLLGRGTKYIPLSEYPESLTTFATVRNPFDRLVSVWAYFVAGGNGIDDDVVRITPKRFDRFVYKFIQNGETFPRQWFIEPMVGMTTDGGREVDRVLRFENIDSDWREFALDHGLPDELPHLRKTDHRYYKDYYDHELVRIVRAYYNEDLERYGYDY